MAQQDWELESGFVEVDEASTVSGESPALRLEAMAERAQVAESASRVTVAASVVAKASEKRRPDVEVCVVLDRSGSMSGSKLALCRSTLELLVKELRASDSFGLVTFDHEVAVEVELGKVDKVSAQRAIARLRSGGTTNLSGGVLTGLDQFSGSAADGVRAVLVLTDGMANVGITDQAALVSAAKSCVPEGVSLFSFGYGGDHQADLLRALSAVTPGGGYYFVDTTDRVVGAFADCLGGMLSVVAQNVELVVRSEGAVITRVRRDGARRLAADHWSVALGDQYAEERRDVVVDLEPLSSARGQATVTFELRFVDALRALVSSASATVAVARLPDADPRLAAVEASPLVAAHVARLDVADALATAQATADKGDCAAAQRVLTDAKAAVARARLPGTAPAEADLLKRLDFDLDACVENTRSAADYAAKGRNQLVSKAMGHLQQRCYSDSDSDDEDRDQVRNIYRGAGKKAVKSKWTLGFKKK